MGRFLNNSTRETLRGLARVSSMGLAMALAIVIGLAIGHFVDVKFGTHPWGFFIGLILGIVAGFRNLYIIAKRSGIF